MNLGQLIDTLAAHPDQNAVLPRGFTHPHSYRGYYECLAFAPAADVPVSEMLAAARRADGTTYQGWKGGDYRMDSGTDVYLAEEGDTGDELSALLLDYMLAAATPTTSPAPQVGDLLTLPAEPPEGTTVRIEGGNSDGQVWEHVHVGLTPDATIRWQLRSGVSGSDWSSWSGLWWRLTEDDGAGQVGIRIAPAPLAVGDTVTTTEELDSLPVGSVVRTRVYVVAERVDRAWRMTGAAGEYTSFDLSLPARVLDLPGATS